MSASSFKIPLTLAQRIVIAELLPKFANRLKLEEKNSHTISFTSEELKTIQQTAETARHRSENGIKRHSLAVFEAKRRDDSAALRLSRR